ncbi:DUF2103 domain-containing protein [Halapricum salinum]|uniref:Metal-binding protein n=1 Tax=Halapricum salinum TaxID=1457250 RepID=A0A4D6HFK9_9EURY|nr:DUF2103 domain-containing protein [Halapricum salinum]QCC51547.1 metal-binding protein [Halapricum salinum]
MECRQCASPLDRPGDYCLVCRTQNAEAVLLDLSRDRARIVALQDDSVVGERTITTTPEDGDETAVIELRNFAGLIADEVRRKRPEEVYVTGDREVVDEVRGQLHYPFYRVRAEDPVAHVIERRGEPALDVVETAPADKLGGSHSTLIGGRDGQRAIYTVAGHPHVKKVIPGPIDAGGGGSRTGVRAKATRAGDDGNVRLLIRDGSSVQENRVVTTAGERELGEHVRADLNEALEDEDLQD